MTSASRTCRSERQHRLGCRRATGATAGEVLLLRPDMHLAARGRADHPERLAEAIAQTLAIERIMEGA